MKGAKGEPMYKKSCLSTTFNQTPNFDLKQGCRYQIVYLISFSPMPLCIQSVPRITKIEFKKKKTC